jgi:hypothetical protein
MMADGAEREWVIYLIGPAGTIEVTVKSDSGPELGSGEVRLGECRFPRETFAGAFPREKIVHKAVHIASRG